LHFERNFPIDGQQADQLVADTERTWRERGYAIERDTFQQVVSIRNATVDGYSMSLVVNRTTSLVVNRTTEQGHLGVSSPCVRHPPEPDRDPDIGLGCQIALVWWWTDGGAVTAHRRSAFLSGGLKPRRLLNNVGVSDARCCPRSVPP
jgi:hypothetical protein